MTAADADPWRPNYERRALILWVVVAVLAAITAGLWGCRRGPFTGSPGFHSPWR